MIRAEGISKSFGLIKAVNNIDISVNKGEIVGLVGPDGAGKTTLMRILVNLLTPDQGSVNMFGNEYGYMPQRFSLYGDLRVMENLLFFGSLYGLDKKTIVERAEEILTLTNLVRFKERFADDLSGGMKQKLALTCALVTRPRLLILDEPTYGVDPESRKDFWKILYDLNKKGLTILVSTPYMDEAELCTKVAFIDKGKVTAFDSPLKLKEEFPYEVWEVRSDSRDPNIFDKISYIKDSSLFGDKYRLIVKNEDPKDGEIQIIIKNKLIELGYELQYMEQYPPAMEDVFVMLAGGE